MLQGVRRDATAALAVLGLLWLAAFSLLYTLGSSTGLWPAGGVASPLLPLRGDLPAGLVFGAAVGASLLRISGIRRPKMSSGLPAAHGGAS